MQRAPMRRGRMTTMRQRVPSSMWKRESVSRVSEMHWVQERMGAMSSKTQQRSHPSMHPSPCEVWEHARLEEQMSTSSAAVTQAETYSHPHPHSHPVTSIHPMPA